MNRVAAPDAAIECWHTRALPPLLRRFGISLLASAPAAGQLIVLRESGATLDAHCHALPQASVLAATADRLAVAAESLVCEFHAGAETIATGADAEAGGNAYRLRHRHSLDAVAPCDLGYGDNSLWLADARTGSLISLAPDGGVAQRWHCPLPDAAHRLAGVALRDGKPAFATAIAAAANGAAAGLIVRIDDGGVLARGAVLPKSPRWYGERLWYLDSGAGRLCALDPQSGATAPVVDVPGCAHSVDFHGGHAFIAFSRRRGNARAVSPDRSAEMECGICVIDLSARRIVAVAGFGGSVARIAAVAVLPHVRPVLLAGSDAVRATADAPRARALADDSRDAVAATLAHAAAAHARGEFQVAIDACRAVLGRCPGHCGARLRLGLALVDAERWREAVDELEAFLAIEPRSAEAHNSLGLAWARLGDYARALRHLDLALAANPAFAPAHFNRSLVDLRLGNFARGWAGYEWRRRLSGIPAFRCPLPQWAGEDIADKVLLVHGEQGAGDVIQFARLLPLAARRCRSLLVLCSASLQPLLARIDGVAETHVDGEAAARRCDVVCPIMSLPWALGIASAEMPAAPYLRAPQRAVAPPSGSRFRIGIAWAGNPTHKDDHRRSCPIGHMLALAGMPGVQCFSLQKPLREGERELLAAHGVVDLERSSSGFADTAARIVELDLVVSVCTSIAHLAGALGTPVWTLLAHHADWRWGTGGETTPWYPSMRLFRQREPGNWAELLARVRVALASVAAGAHPPTQRDRASESRIG